MVKSYSCFMKQSRAPEEPLPKKKGKSFFLDAALEGAVNRLIQEGKYIGKILPRSSSGNYDGLIFVEESVTTKMIGIQEYISELPTYTEKHCRIIFRQIVSIIKLCHSNGLAHRNLKLTSILVDKGVSHLICTIFNVESHLTIRKLC
jgi:serine/threonine protein kinase